MKIGAILLLSVLTTATVYAESSSDLDAGFNLADELPSATLASPCGDYTVGKTYSHRHFVDMLAQTKIMDTMRNTDNPNARLGFDVQFSVEPLKPLKHQNRQTATLFRLDVMHVVLIDEAPGHKAAKDIVSKMLRHTLDPSNQDLALAAKFKGFFYYRQSCDGDILEVKHSQDEMPDMVIAKKAMAASFFHATGGPETPSEILPEMTEPTEEEKGKQWCQPNDEGMDDEDDEDDEEDHEESELAGKMHLSTEGDTVEEAIEVETPHAKQPEAKQPVKNGASSHCQKTSEAVVAEDKPSKDAHKCALATAKLSSRVNRTCTKRPRA